VERKASRTRSRDAALFSGTYGLGSRDFRPEHIIAAFEYATAGRARKDGKTLQTAHRSSCSASIIPMK
jgi:pyruvate/2-oxoacid:ferredoxin oxidoreductase alpha subunit